ncbi:MAG: hypothetical protein K6T83_21850 [Alicyclobacillus sp.]|nr:hypothetical protein [Alicyclobacillus sp.]
MMPHFGFLVRPSRQSEAIAMTPNAFTSSSLHTIAGAAMATLLLTQMAHRLPGLRRLPDYWLDVGFGELVFGLSSPVLPSGVAAWVTLLLNGLLVAAVATGSVRLVSTSILSQETIQRDDHKYSSR